MSAPATLVHGSGKSMSLVPTRIALRLRDPAPKDFAKKLDASPLVDLDDGRDLFAPSKAKTHRAVAHRPNLLWLRTKSPSPLVEKALADASGEHLHQVAPVYQLAGHGPEGLVLVDTDRLLVSSPLPAEKLNEVLKKVGLKVDTAFSARIKPHYVVIRDGAKTVLGLAEVIRKELSAFISHVSYDCIHLLETGAALPTDPLYGTTQQAIWQHHGLEAAWQQVSSAGMRVAILDQGGLDLGHPDLDLNTRGALYLGWERDGQGWGPGRAGGGGPGGHPTAMAGVVWAASNTIGIAGIASDATLYYANAGASTAEVYDALVAVWDGAPGGNRPHVILFPQVGPGWDSPQIRQKLAEIIADTGPTRGAIVCVPTGPSAFPEDPTNTTVLFPAAVPGVLAVGATEISGANDPRLAADPTSEGSRYLAPPQGQGVILTATGLDVETLLEGGGYGTIRGTSAASAFTAGIAVLARAKYPTLSAAEVQDILVRSAKKSGPYTYSEGAAPTPSQILSSTLEVGYGQINAKQALDYADVYIRDGAGDTGQEPSGIASFWAYSDVLIFDAPQAITDQSFLPQPTTANDFHNPSAAAPAHAYVRVVNKGPNPAVNVRVRLVLGESSTGWAFPRDWLAGNDSTHVVAIDPNTSQPEVVLGTIASGATGIAHFIVNQPIPWLGAGAAAHVCSMPSVRADNDYPFEATLSALAGGAFGGEQPVRNNVAQRNLTVLHANSPWTFSFWVGRASSEAVSTVHVDASKLRGLDPIQIRMDPTVHPLRAAVTTCDAITVLDDTRLHVRLGSHVGVLHAKAGSRFEPEVTHALSVAQPAGLLPIDGVVQLPRVGVVRVPRPTLQPARMNLQIPMPADFADHESVDVDIIERSSDGRVLGGIRLHLVR